MATKSTSVYLLLALLAAPSMGQVPALQISKQEANKAAYMLSARQTDGTRSCGPNQQITNGWIVETEQYWLRLAGVSAGTEVTTVGGYFQTATGLFQAPVSGVYYLGASARCETSDCDITIRNNGARVCAFGTDQIDRQGDTSNFGGTWTSTLVECVEYLNVGGNVVLWYESGQSNDCTLETSFRYTHLNAWLYVADVLPTTLTDGPLN